MAESAAILAGTEPATEPSPGRRERRRRELHARVLATAAELFARDGYDATTVERISAEADIAPATFFNHFPSKEDVLRELGADVFARFHRLVDEQLAREDANTAGRLAGFAARSGDLVHRAPEMTRRVLVAVLRTSRPGESGPGLAAMEASFEALLAKGREAGDVRRDLDLGLAAEILVSVVIGAMSHWIQDETWPLGRRLGQLLAELAEGFLAPAASAHAPAQRVRDTVKGAAAKARTTRTAAKRARRTRPTTTPRPASKAGETEEKP